jgi:hypothetical protein
METEMTTYHTSLQPAGAGYEWIAVTDDYDGADIDANTPSRDPIGHGETELAALTDLISQIVAKELTDHYRDKWNQDR